MIRQLDSLDGWASLIRDLSADPAFSDPMLSTQEELELNLLRAFENPNKRVLGVLSPEGGKLGLFVFLASPPDKNVEMLVGLSRSPDAYEEIVAWLRGAFPGYQADFVFNPANRPLRELLLRLGAFFDPEQQTMRLTGETPFVDTAGVEPLSEKTLPQYLAMHSTDMFWTGEKVAQTPQRFNVFLAVEDGVVAGYIDVTNCYEENEPCDLLVKEEYRRRGWGRKLLAKAIEENRPRDMMLLVDTDNAGAIALYSAMGFTAVPGRNSQTANWQIP